jgi:hypothetical protein
MRRPGAARGEGGVTQPAPAQRGTDLRTRAEALGQTLPPLLAEAEMLAATVMLGEHGRRRAGLGDEFWQYRAAHAGDPARMIDWRRSARSDLHFVREREWQAAQSVTLWVDSSKSMAFAGAKGRASKADRARLLAMALAVLLLRGGERVGLAGLAPPRSGRAQIMRLAARLAEVPETADYGAPEVAGMVAHGRAAFFSDFLGPLDGVEIALAQAADRGARGVLCQILDPAEEEFPFDGRTVFESMGGSLRHETRQARDLRDRYLARLAERKDRLATLARGLGWHYSAHHTGQPAQAALLWLYRRWRAGADVHDRSCRISDALAAVGADRAAGPVASCCAPCRQRRSADGFPGVALLLGLADEDAETDRTPWWLLLLRMLAVAAAIIGFAGPVLNPERSPVRGRCWWCWMAAGPMRATGSAGRPRRAAGEPRPGRRAAPSRWSA